LPEAYGTGSFWLTARDPHCLYAHWDLTPEQQRHYNRLAAHRHLAVRVRTEPADDPASAEIHVHPESGHWFIHVEQAGRTYLAELGYYGQDGHWRRLALSEPAATPPERVAEPAPVRFATVPPPNAPPRSPSWRFEPGVAAPALPAASALPQGHAPAPPPRPQSFGPHESLSAPAPIPRAPAAIRTQTGSGEVAPEVWTAAQEQALAELMGWTFTRSESFGSEQVIEREGLERRRAMPLELASLAAAQLAPVEAISSPGPLGISSVPAEEQPPQKGFWFNINAELIVYGATEPAARVTIGGRRIRLRPDGTFSYRFALPDGFYTLPIEATATRGDQRAARLEFFRQTQLSGHVAAHPQDPGLKTPGVENVS
jgi:uncharacterized protein